MGTSDFFCFYLNLKVKFWVVFEVEQLNLKLIMPPKNEVKISISDYYKFENETMEYKFT